jgi:O-methyltransferase
MPQTNDARDVHSASDFADTSLESVRRLVGSERWIDYRAGLVPETFRGLEDSRIRFAHVDLDIYDAILAACEFVYPRLSPCGVMVFDDYGFWSCPGARAAVDEFFRDRPEAPVCLPTGQALVVKLPESR